MTWYPAPNVRATFGGNAVFDTQRAIAMCDTGHIALYYIPCEDAGTGLLTRTDHSILCPFKGHAT